MLYAAIDIHKHAFQATVLDPETGVVVEERFAADRENLQRWAERWRGRVAAVAIEATTGWRWVWRELAREGFDVRLAEPVQTRALLGRRRSAKTDRLDARWLARLLAKEMLPESWIPPAQIQELRDRTRLRKALAEDRRRWGQRLQVDSLLAVMAALETQLDTSTRSCVASPAPISAAGRCSRSTGSGRSWPATCSPRSARPVASSILTRSPGWPASTP